MSIRASGGGGGMANPMTTGGDVIYGGASGVATRLANGAAGAVLTSAGTALAPTWTAPAAPSFPLRGPDGEAGAPTYSFTGSTDTGMWHSSETIYFTSSGDNIAFMVSLTGTRYLAPTNAGTLLGYSTVPWGQGYINELIAKDFTLERTITAGGTTVPQTIDKMAGRINIAATETSKLVTNSKVTTSSLIFCTISTNDSTATIKNVVAATGSFTITLTAAATAETAVAFLVSN